MSITTGQTPPSPGCHRRASTFPRSVRFSYIAEPVVCRGFSAVENSPSGENVQDILLRFNLTLTVAASATALLPDCRGTLGMNDFFGKAITVDPPHHFTSD
ncbi:hypothetical protein SRHO_G00297770 [Serrasalmus rhombeus]